MKYYFRVIGVRSSEYQFELKTVQALEAAVDPKEYFTNIAKTFYDNGEGKEGEQYFNHKEEFYFFGGEVCAWLDSFQEVTEQEFEVLNKYL